MDEGNIKASAALVGDSYMRLGAEATRSLSRKVRSLITQRQIPQEPWSSLEIEQVLLEIATLDSSNYDDRAGVGEREGRCFSTLVARRCYYMTHGVGRSGDVLAVQPKAAGSSLIGALAQSFALHALHISGLQVRYCALVPLATGMSLALVYQALRQSRPNARYIVWSRIDQKTCLKAIYAAGFEPIIVETQLQEDVVTMGDIEATLGQLDLSTVLCVCLTASCFAPRVPDPVVAVASLCKRLDLPLVINNAYGLQCSKITHDLSEAIRTGRVDAIVQSTDKNFLVPVGGAIVASPAKGVIKAISELYPGRASAATALDFFVTMLEMGVSGYQKLLSDRKELKARFVEGLGRVGEKHGERLLRTPGNTISFALTLGGNKQPGELGAMLFARRVSGTRAIAASSTKEVCGRAFPSYGASYSHYPTNYLTAACAIGLTPSELERFLERLDAALSENTLTSASAS